MESAGKQREQARAEPVVEIDRQRRANANTFSPWPLSFNDAHSPALRLGQAFGPPYAALPIGLQAKLTINEPGDEYEQEADRVAEQVMRTPDPAIRLQRKCGCDGSAGTCECGSSESLVQRRSLPRDSLSASTAPSIVHEVIGNSGQPLDNSTRAFMEQRFNQDFGDVRVHVDGRGHESARAVNALAYTVGRDVVFGLGQYAPNTAAGKKLIAHELTHVVQQRGGPKSGASSPVAPGPARAALQRKVDVAANSSVFKITQEPSTALQIQNIIGKWRAKPITATAIKFEGAASATCDTGDSAKGFELGIVQIETKEVNNARYQGIAKTDGSVWLRHDIPAVRPPGPCVDASYRKFWQNPVALTCGATAATSYSDWPGDMYPTVFENPLTKKPNYLTELHAGFEFTTALMVKAPADRLQVLRWVTWEVGWDYIFDTPVSGQSVVKKGLTRSGTMQFTNPEPAPPELPTKYAIPAKNCNTLTMEASDNPAGIQASKTW
jgi:hypothetical protein